MRKSVAPFAHKTVALCAAFVLAFSMVPAAWADDGPAGTVAGTVAGAEGAEGSEGAFGSEVPTSPRLPSGPSAEASAEVQPADAKAAASTGLAVYLSDHRCRELHGHRHQLLVA